MRILYVCENNIIRSAAAEILTREKTTNLHTLQVDSAGLKAYNLQLKPTSCFFTALQKAGYKTRRHIPKNVTLDLLKVQDLVICMEYQQVEEILSMAPEMTHKICTLAEFSNEDVPDLSELLEVAKPTDREATIEFWSDYIKKIERCIDSVISRIKREGIIS